MNTNEVETLRDEEESRGKRAYRRPFLQVYGTLKDVSQASFQENPHQQDNPAPFPTPFLRPFNRT